MYIADCSFKFSPDFGLIVRPAALDTDWQQGELQVTFRPRAFFPEEPDIGQGADFWADIRTIKIRDIEDTGKHPWHTLAPRDKKRAEAFLEAHFRQDMWNQAFDETAEAFGVETHARAA